MHGASLLALVQGLLDRLAEVFAVLAVAKLLSQSSESFVFLVPAFFPCKALGHIVPSNALDPRSAA